MPALIFYVLFTLVPVLYVIRNLLRGIVGPFFSPLRQLPGPKSPSWATGHFLELWKPAKRSLYERWEEEFGRLYVFRGLLSSNYLFMTDLKVLNYVLQNPLTYPMPGYSRLVFRRILGEGVLVTDGEAHKNQRRILNPAFNLAQIRGLTDVFLDKSNQLCDVWRAASARNPDAQGRVRVDILAGLGHATLDMIGLAGFQHDFRALNGRNDNEFYNAFKKGVNATQKFNPMNFLTTFIPSLAAVPTAWSQTLLDSKSTMKRIGMVFVQERKAKILEEKGAGVARDSIVDRDLLSILLRANMAVDMPASRRMSDEEVLEHIVTFIGAGHETTSTSTTYAVYALACNPRVQSKLREELATVGTDTPTLDELNALPYLDAVIKETLRLYGPVTQVSRRVAKDDVLQLSKPFTDINGRVHEYIKVRKDDYVNIPITAVNKSREIWGPDADKLVPERWASIPAGAQDVPGVWGQQLTFIGGPRSCIGYRFAIAEMKALLFALVRAFEFELAVPEAEMQRTYATIVNRPVVDDPVNPYQLPLLIKPVVV